MPTKKSKKSNKADIETLAQMSEAERQALLEYSKSVPDIEVNDEFFRGGAGAVRKNVRLWSSNPDIVDWLNKTCLEIMGPDSPYQFFQIRKFWSAYREKQTEVDQYGKYASIPELKVWIRKWIWANAPDWEEKSEQRRNTVTVIYPYGSVVPKYAGFGKKDLSKITNGMGSGYGVASVTCWLPESERKNDESESNPTPAASS